MENTVVSIIGIYILQKHFPEQKLRVSTPPKLLAVDERKMLVLISASVIPSCAWLNKVARAVAFSEKQIRVLLGGGKKLRCGACTQLLKRKHVCVVETRDTWHPCMANR